MDSGEKRTAPPALECEALTKRFGGLEAVSHVTLQVEAGERRAIIGPNGAGKTTLFRLISGEFPVDFRDDPAVRPRDHAHALPPEGGAGTGENIPGHQSLPDHDRGGQPGDGGDGAPEDQVLHGQAPFDLQRDLRACR